jgi:hypothetical protein
MGKPLPLDSILAVRIGTVIHQSPPRTADLFGDFEVLRRLRGRDFDRGVRNRGAFFYALLLSRAPAQSGGCMDVADVAAHLAAFGAQCRPALTAAEQRNALRQARKAKSPMSGYGSNDRLFYELAVTVCSSASSRPAGAW